MLRLSYSDNFPLFRDSTLLNLVDACTNGRITNDAADPAAKGARALLAHGVATTTVLDRERMRKLARMGRAELVRLLLRHGAPCEYDAALTAFLNGQTNVVRVYEERRGPVHTRIMMFAMASTNIISFVLAVPVLLCMGSLVFPIVAVLMLFVTVLDCLRPQKRKDNVCTSHLAITVPSSSSITVEVVGALPAISFLRSPLLSRYSTPGLLCESIAGKDRGRFVSR